MFVRISLNIVSKLGLLSCCVALVLLLIYGFCLCVAFVGLLIRCV